MRRLILMTMAVLACMAVAAQKRKAAPKAAPVTVEEHIAAYRFAEAAKQLKTEIAELRRRRKPCDDKEAQLETVETLASLLDATQHVVFIDSMVVDKEGFFRHFALSEESGRITSYAQMMRTADTLGCTAFQPDLGKTAYVACPSGDGGSRLCLSTFASGEWTASEPLAGLGDARWQNFPFVMGDGCTLYYGAAGADDGLGGYDIYTTRWDADERRYLQPEHLDFPFNSPANDYMMVIDEVNSLGWFVTDRRQPADRVCIYVFIPETIRRNWIDTNGMTQTRLASLARIMSIADTQRGAPEVAAARTRLAEARKGVVHRAAANDFTFVVRDGVVRHSLDEFASPQARAAAQRWYEADVTLRATERLLASLRLQYRDAGEERRAQMRAKILTLEREYETQTAETKRLANEVRKIENPR